MDLTNQKDQLETILDSISDGVFTVDADWLITYFNNAAEKITGVPRAVSGRVRRSQGRYLLHLETRRGRVSAQRTLQGEDCATLVESAALIIALFSNPSASPATQEAPDEQKPSPPPPPPRSWQVPPGPGLVG